MPNLKYLITEFFMIHLVLSLAELTVLELVREWVSLWEIFFLP